MGRIKIGSKYLKTSGNYIANGLGDAAILALNPVLWLDASDLSTFSLRDVGGIKYVEEWRDKSGNGRHWFESTATLQPRLLDDHVLIGEEKAERLRWDSIGGEFSSLVTSIIVLELVAYNPYQEYSVIIYFPTSGGTYTQNHRNNYLFYVRTGDIMYQYQTDPPKKVLPLNRRTISTFVSSLGGLSYFLNDQEMPISQTWAKTMEHNTGSPITNGFIAYYSPSIFLRAKLFEILIIPSENFTPSLLTDLMAKHSIPLT